MVGELARYNAFTMDLDQRFADLVGYKKLKLVGVDVFENKFIVNGILGPSERIVKAEDSASYFDAYKIIPDSDHFSIVKPTSATHESHQRLYDFFETIYVPFVAVAGKASDVSPSSSTIWIEISKNPLTILWPSLSDGFEMTNVRDKQARWFFKNFPTPIFSLHGHAIQGVLEKKVGRDQFQVRGHSEHIIAQTTKEHVFSIAIDYENLSAEEKITVITDDPKSLRRQVQNFFSRPLPR